MGMGMETGFVNPMGMGMGMETIFKNGYGCGYSSTRPTPIPTSHQASFPFHEDEFLG